MIEARVQKDFPGKRITNIDGGKKTSTKSDNDKGFLSKIFSKSDPKKKPEDGVDLKFDGWTRGGFDAVFLADFTITNNNPYPIKDLEIICNGYAESGTRIDSNTRDIYTTLQPGETKTYKKFNMGFLHSQVKKIGCSIKNVEKGN
jgi:hypothetical protein